MTATTATPADASTRAADERRAGFARLVAVELRKTVDTRSARWLLAVVLLLPVVGCAVTIGTAGAPGVGFTDLFSLSALLASILLRVVAILTVTAEFTTRSITTSALLEPRRLRLGLAKVAAVTVLALAVSAALVVVAAAMTAVSAAFGSPLDPWAVEPAAVLGTSAHLVLLALVGVALGLLLTSSALAVVCWFVAPTALSLTAGLVESLAGPLGWVDTATFTALDGLGAVPVTGEQWARMAVTTAVWVVLPGAAGLVRLSRRELL
jgi:ABC-type transport system involved in multi-copper enzyme maturation permease subunit